MWPYLPHLLATPAPRYTSFPTAAEFTDGVSAQDMAEALAGIGGDEPVSLYLHIPYCRQICWYCGCTTGAANKSSRLAGYLDRLSQEIGLVSQRLGGRGVVGRVAWGGGSPNAVAPEQFDALATRVRQSFDCTNADWSVELDPRGFDGAWADTIARNGVTRASLGVQTFAEHVQRAIGRVQPLSMVEVVVRELRDSGVTSLNFDLMYGLPGQSVDDLDRTLEQAIALSPDRLAVFGYAHVPQMLPRQRRIDASALPDGAMRFQMAERAHATLVAAGYQAIGFDHFARPGDPMARAAREGMLRRNFQGFTDDPAEVLIGMGASAISSFPGYLLQNEKNAGRYQLCIANGLLATTRGWRRSGLDRLRGRAIEALLCDGAVDLGALPDRDTVRHRLAPFVEADLIRWTGWRVALMPGAAAYARVIAMTIDNYRAHSATRFSSAV